MSDASFTNTSLRPFQPHRHSVFAISRQAFERGGRGKLRLARNDAGDDLLDGGDGNDARYGHAGRDTLRGGAGADRLFGNEGFDTIDGGLDTDTGRKNDSIVREIDRFV
jgi:Ca2+-binding RTX toxin-like protein